MNLLKNRTIKIFIIFAITLLFTGCFSKVQMFQNSSDPLKETVLEGDGEQKILLIPIHGVISSDSSKRMLGPSKPGMMPEFISKLKKAESDESIKAVIISINSPGGTVTASDIIYNEIRSFKKKTNKKVIVIMMDVAASGGYYVSIPADYIIAHPTTITGSIGVITMRQDLKGLMSKIGIGVTVYKSGKNKDMGSPFRISTGEEKKMMQNIVTNLANRFVGLVVKKRGISGEKLKRIKTARVFLPREALEVGLIDKIGYFKDAVKKAKQLSKIPENSQVVVYKRSQYFDDNVYNSAGANIKRSDKSLLGLDIIPNYKTGFYYMWVPGE
ncbi:MAG: signal peptide peptidase SppA [Desulfobacterales bacterium]|nr:signal peptide peptidase SppA [Desulfobacterales bacterium]MCP4162068.1 signal peptide peptidase SppA [Deltaproteobacteria bacterium]